MGSHKEKRHCSAQAGVQSTTFGYPTGVGGVANLSYGPHPGRGARDCLPVYRVETSIKGGMEEVPMYLTEIVWWGYTAFVAVAALFLLWFAHKIGDKGG